MNNLLMAVAVVATLLWSGIIRPEILVVNAVTQDTAGEYTATLVSRAGTLYTTDVAEPGDLAPGSAVAAVLFDNGTPDNPSDDTILGMRPSGYTVSDDGVTLYAKSG